MLSFELGELSSDCADFREMELGWQWKAWRGDEQLDDATYS